MLERETEESYYKGSKSYKEKREKGKYK